MRRVFLGKTQQDLLGDGDKLVLEILGEPSTPAPTATAEEQPSGAGPPSSQTSAGGGGRTGLGPRCCQLQPSAGRGTKAIQWRMQQPLQQMENRTPHAEKGAMATPSHLAQRDVRHIVHEDGRPGGWERGPPADPEGGRGSCPTGSRERRDPESSCCSRCSKGTVPL